MSLSQQNSTQKWAVIVLYWHNQFEDTWLDNEEDTFVMWKLSIITKHLLLPAKYFKKQPKSKKRENPESKTTGRISSFASYHEENPSFVG